ncbi:hypothetical protein E2C01_072635 [Portunus trituberculatus]|uniref:Uncharacterized protein n=1 Tax=Portunus trituberculatus TaxID=210409 RepID=A0A5B7I781_PORTR|nr:hypothetical protein [Portunus trituberculatus]
MTAASSLEPPWWAARHPPAPQPPTHSSSPFHPCPRSTQRPGSRGRGSGHKPWRKRGRDGRLSRLKHQKSVCLTGIMQAREVSWCEGGVEEWRSGEG